LQQLSLHINGGLETFDLLPGQVMCVDDLIRQKQLTHQRIAIELNRVIVNRSAFQHTKLNSGDKIEIVSAIGGG